VLRLDVQGRQFAEAAVSTDESSGNAEADAGWYRSSYRSRRAKEPGAQLTAESHEEKQTSNSHGYANNSNHLEQRVLLGHTNKEQPD
jgi:hypothetical protein